MVATMYFMLCDIIPVAVTANHMAIYVHMDGHLSLKFWQLNIRYTGKKQNSESPM